MFKKIENPAAYELRAVIRFVNAGNMKLDDIHQLCEVYGEHVTSDSMKKSSKACYVIRNMKHHYSFFYSVMSYGIIFWGNSSCSYDIFLLQKKAIT
jgi:hypothetical protein